jgi:hypothetical protein
MRAGGEVFAQPLRRERNRIWPRHTDGVEALRPRGLDQGGFQRSRSQKSRLA